MYGGVSGVKQEERSLVAENENLDNPGGLSSIRGSVYIEHSHILLSLNYYF